jgi:hypothetical protein
VLAEVPGLNPDELLSLGRLVASQLSLTLGRPEAPPDGRNPVVPKS